MAPIASSLRIATRLAQRWYRHSSFLLTFLIPVAVVMTSCSKQADSAGTESAPRAADGPATDANTTAGPKVPVMVITYQTQYTPNQYSSPPGMRLAATRGEEIRYLDLNNNRMRVEKYVLDNSKKRLHQTIIIDETGSYRFEPGKNEAFFNPMVTPVPVWNFDQNVNTKWARERQLTVKPGEWLKRPCDVVEMGTGNNVWLWNEIPLKREQKQVGSDTVVEAYKIEENASTDASMLQVPADMKIKSATGVVPPKQAMAH